MLINNWRTNKEVQYNKRQGDILVKSLSSENNKELMLQKEYMDLKKLYIIVLLEKKDK